MEARVRAKVAAAHLTRDSELSTVPFIGRTLAARISAVLRRPRATLGQVLAHLQQRTRVNLEQQVAAGVGQLCQNPRANQCVRGYAVRDVNKGCALALAFALQGLGAGPRPHRPAVARGLTSAFDRVVTRTSIVERGARISPAAQCPCFTRGVCERRYTVCRWTGAHCLPRYATLGFEGVLPFSGQTDEADDGAIRRGAYDANWRIPGPLSAVLSSNTRVALRAATVRDKRSISRLLGISPAALLPRLTAGQNARLQP